MISFMSQDKDDCFQNKPNLQQSNMKFEKQRISNSLAGKLELNNQEFLTFRNNHTSQNTGRTVYSQQFDYRSLQKYSPEEELDPLRCNFKKSIRNVRSTQKYKLISEQALSQMTDQNGEYALGSQRQRSEELKGRISYLLKLIKRAQKKHIFLNEEIATLEELVEVNNEEIQKSRNGVEELTQIYEENLTHCSTMNARIKDLEDKARELSQHCSILDSKMEAETNSRTKDRDTPEFHIKLQQGMKELQAMGEQMDIKISLMEQEIYRLEEKIEEIQALDNRVKSIGTF